MDKKTILVVEDNPMNMKLVRSLFRLTDLQIIEATDAEKGLTLAQEKLPALILMDIQLPGMDGLEATRRLKSNPSVKDIPIVAITSHAMQGDEEKCLEAGCNGYISKPINTRTFIQEVSKYIEQKASEPQSGMQDKPTAQHKINAAKHKVLIVDDNPKNVRLFAGCLAGQEYEILKAYDGEEALKITARELPDVIILDVMMPGLSGFEVTRELRRNEDTKNIPIIIVTALSSNKDKIEALDAGADEFLTKPINRAELIARVGSMLKLRQYQEQLDIRNKTENSFRIQDEAALDISLPEGEHRVLVVEDNRKDQKLLLRNLQQLPVQVDVAGSGEHALELAMQGGIDVILLDIILPGANGYDICMKLKKMEETKDIQIILITCLDDLESKIKGVQTGADDYLVKPFDPRELIARTKALLRKKDYLDQLHDHCKQAINSAIIDGLTGIYNHAYFKQIIDLEFNRSRRKNHPISLLMIDLDNFKKLNDSYGHVAGDVVLRETAHIIKNNIREIDLVARYGGEEFVVLLPYADRAECQRVANRLLASIRAKKFCLGAPATDIRITASIGGAIYPEDASYPVELIEKADTLLYQAKEAGKDRAIVCSNTKVTTLECSIT